MKLSGEIAELFQLKRDGPDFASIRLNQIVRQNLWNNFNGKRSLFRFESFKGKPNTNDEDKI